MKIDMIASKRMKYGTRMLNAGEAFQASSRDVRLLEAIKKAKRAAPPEPEPQPAPPAAEATEEEPPAQRRRGRRRKVEEQTEEAGSEGAE